MHKKNQNFQNFKQVVPLNTDRSRVVDQPLDEQLAF